MATVPVPAGSVPAAPVAHYARRELMDGETILADGAAPGPWATWLCAVLKTGRALVLVELGGIARPAGMLQCSEMQAGWGPSGLWRTLITSPT